MNTPPSNVDEDEDLIAFYDAEEEEEDNNEMPEDERGNCPHCGGSGFESHTGGQCHPCGGTGDIDGW